MDYEKAWQKFATNADQMKKPLDESVAAFGRQCAAESFLEAVDEWNKWGRSKSNDFGEHMVSKAASLRSEKARG